MPCGPDHCNHCAGLTAGRFDEKGMNNNAKQVEMKIMVLIIIYLLCICVFRELDNSAPSNGVCNVAVGGKLYKCTTPCPLKSYCSQVLLGWSTRFW